MGYGEKFGPRFVRPEHEVVRESAEPRPAQAGIERLETARSGGDEFDSAIQLIQEPVCRAQLRWAYHVTASSASRTAAG